MAEELTYKDVLRDPQYMKLLFSNLINRFGDSIDAIAFTWLVYRITNSASWTALIFGLNLLPNIVIQPFLGPIVERLNKKKVIVFTHILRGSVILAFVLMYLAGLVNPYIMTGFTLVITTIESFNLPASMAIIPSIVSKEKLAHAMSLNSSLSSAVSLVGISLEGVIIARLSVQSAMFIDIATFFIAALIMMFVKTVAETEDNTPEAPEGEQVDQAQAGGSYIYSLKEGIKYVLRNSVMLDVCIFAVFINFFTVPIQSMQAPVADEVYKLGSGFLSVSGIAGSIGGIIGAAITPWIMRKFPVKKILVLGGVIFGGFMFLFSLGGMFGGAAIPGYLWAAMCYIVLAGSSNIMAGTVNIQFEKSCDQNYLARAGAVLGAASMAATPLGAFLVSLVTVYIGPGVLIGIFGIMVMAMMIPVFMSKADYEIAKGEVTNES